MIIMLAKLNKPPKHCNSFPILLVVVLNSVLITLCAKNKGKWTKGRKSDQMLSLGDIWKGAEVDGTRCGQLDLWPSPSTAFSNMALFENKLIPRSLFRKISKRFGSGFVTVEQDCRVDICGYTDGDIGYCQAFNRTIKLPDHPYSNYFTLSSASCACKKNRTRCLEETCGTASPKLSELDCGVLYREPNCQECYYDGYVLNLNVTYKSRNSAAITSVFVKPGCVVELIKYGRFSKVDTANPFITLFNESTSGLKPCYSSKGEEFRCYCETFAGMFRKFKSYLFPVNPKNESKNSSISDWKPHIEEHTTSSTIDVQEGKTIELYQDVGASNNSMTNNDENNLAALSEIIAKSILYAMIGTALLILGIYFLSRNWPRKILSEREIEQFKIGIVDGSEVVEMKTISNSETTYPPALRLPYDESGCEKKRSDIILESKIGVGAYGVVYKGKLRISENTFRIVAIKTIVKPDASSVNSLLNEIKLLARFAQDRPVCPYIVSFIGACTAKSKWGDVLSILEFCHFGSLEDYLKDQKRLIHSQSLRLGPDYSPDIIGSEFLGVSKISDELLNHLIKWSEHIARGMDYLNSKRVVHIDLAARNVLLSNQLTAKISDFGLSRHLYAKLDYKKLGNDDLLPTKWLAIECLQHKVFSVKSDVWSYGITLYEIFNLIKKPYANIIFLEQLICFLKGEERLECPDHATEDIYKMMLQCWNSKPELRPDFADLANFFQNKHRDF